MVRLVNLTGSSRQIAYAASIRDDLWRRYPNLQTLQALERRSDADFWIARRTVDYEQIISDAFDTKIISGPFTGQYPRYDHADACSTLAQLACTPYIALDCETSGISPKKHEVIELAIVATSGEVLFDSLLRPHGEIEEKASAVNGITSEMLADAPRLPDVWGDICEILESSHITSYNADFDLRFLRASAQRWRLDTPPLRATCIMKTAQAYFELDSYPSLSEAAELLEIDTSEFGETHTALADARTAAEILRRMIAEEQQREQKRNYPKGGTREEGWYGWRGIPGSAVRSGTIGGDGSRATE